ncbi:S-formylglutathione hydrolase [uncultured Cohaesibacter sp.]|uniref:S-formylglutathione hydrolase n=1 Tax=uncultured Cohaesibacter sp. TaxID=1002546 RepID=UPI002AAAAB33|nr:S-formylglutathione hydrolase [uncultured Cohaesibacter sp.]
MDRIEQHASFGGTQSVYQHASQVLGCDMKVAVFVPAHEEGEHLPVLYWLSGLTCTEQNFITKAGAQRYAAEHGVILVAPDTSPRGEGVADDEAYDLGQGAGFYLNATQEPWAKHFRMEDYITKELPALIEATFPASDKRSIMGHSMGGHGALTLALRHPGLYLAVSAFSPIVAPTQVPWGEKAFSAYLGDDREAWKAHDATALLASAKERLPILIDQGDADDFLAGQLKPEIFEAEAKRVGHPLTLRMQGGHDHSYYFIASFIGDHIAHHAKGLQA